MAGQVCGKAVTSVGRGAAEEGIKSPRLAPQKEGENALGLHPRSNDMIPYVHDQLSTRIDGNPFAIMGNTVPPRDPDGDEEDENDEDDEEEDRADEPPVVREPDED